MDSFTPDQRSEIMSRIKSSGTRPEDRLYGVVRDALDGRWRVDRNCPDLAGKPDIYIPSLGIVFFLDGCFFHACPDHCRMPKTNAAYWRRKIASNVVRDRRCRSQLRRQGLAVWRFWEHELRNANLDAAKRRVQRAIDAQRSRKPR